MKNTLQKGSAAPAIIAIVVIIIAIGIYFIATKNNSSTNTDTSTSTSATTTTSTNSTSTSATVKTYTNSKYGFTFNYPTNWKVTENKDGKSVKVDSNDMTPGGMSGNLVPVYSVTFTASSTSEFGAQITKVGAITYDPTRQTLVDSSAPSLVRCLPSSVNIGGHDIGIEYGGSQMSTPAHFESAVLTNKDYMILVEELADTSDARTKAEAIIFNSFKFINGVSARTPNCDEVSSTVDTGLAVFTDPTFGFSFSYPNDWLVNKSGNVITLNAKLGVGNWNGGTTTITEVVDQKVTDTSGGAKFLPVSYYYKNNQLMQSGGGNGMADNSAQGEKLATISAHTVSGLPIVDGALQHGYGLYTYVVPLSQTKFLFVSGQEDNGSLLDFVKTITK